MTNAPSDPPPATVSSDDTGIASGLQKRLDEQAEENARLKMQLDKADAKIAKVDEKTRDELKQNQPMVVDWIKHMVEENPTKQNAIGEVLKWGENVHSSKIPEAEKPLMELLVCASAKHKRNLADTNSRVEMEGVLKAKCTEFDKVSVERDELKKRCGELEELCMTSQSAKEVLIRKSVESASHNFSAKSQRESEGGDAMDTSANPMARDELMEFITSTGTPSGRAWQHPGSGHAVYGSNNSEAGPSGLSIGERIRIGA